MTPAITAPPAENTRRFYALHLALPALLFAVVLGSFEATNLDRTIQDLFYDPVTRSFPHRIHWLFETVIHDFGKLTVIALGSLLLGAALLSRWLPSLRGWRRPFLYAALCLALEPLAVRELKHTTGIHCPRALAIYGGNEPYVRIFDPRPEGYEPGHCWPGGHSSGGFAMMSLYFAFRRRRPALARAWLIGGFLYGFTLGMSRVVYGAHFVSHNLWAAAVCWGISLICYELILRRHEAPQVASWRPRPGASAAGRGIGAIARSTG